MNSMANLSQAKVNMKKYMHALKSSTKRTLRLPALRYAARWFTSTGSVVSPADPGPDSEVGTPHFTTIAEIGASSKNNSKLSTIVPSSSLEYHECPEYSHMQANVITAETVAMCNFFKAAKMQDAPMSQVEQAEATHLSRCTTAVINDVNPKHANGGQAMGSSMAGAGTSNHDAYDAPECSPCMQCVTRSAGADSGSTWATHQEVKDAIVIAAETAAARAILHAADVARVRSSRGSQQRKTTHSTRSIVTNSCSFSSSIRQGSPKDLLECKTQAAAISTTPARDSQQCKTIKSMISSLASSCSFTSSGQHAMCIQPMREFKQCKNMGSAVSSCSPSLSNQYSTKCERATTSDQLLRESEKCKTVHTTISSWSLSSSIQHDAYGKDAAISNQPMRESTQCKTIKSVSSLCSLSSSMEHDSHAEAAAEIVPKLQSGRIPAHIEAPQHDSTGTPNTAQSILCSALTSPFARAPQQCQTVRSVGSSLDSACSFLSVAIKDVPESPLSGADASSTPKREKLSTGTAKVAASSTVAFSGSLSLTPPGATVEDAQKCIAGAVCANAINVPLRHDSLRTETVRTSATSSINLVASLARKACITAAASACQQRLEREVSLDKRNSDGERNMLELAAAQVLQPWGSSRGNEPVTSLATSFDPSFYSLADVLPPLAAVADFQGAWELLDEHEQLPELWLRCFIITGRFFFSGDGSENCLRLGRGDGSILLDGGVLSAEEGILSRVGKSGTILRFQRFELPPTDLAEDFQGVWKIFEDSAQHVDADLHSLTIKGLVWRAGGQGGILKLGENGSVCLHDAAELFFEEENGEIGDNLCISIGPETYVQYAFKEPVEYPWHRT